ncbi:MAG TPA: hypothetical protein VG225_01035 [Terracidiphilus sp.]|jgi:hypothetical protein|nr:hypothetical protein [Terracidiphilus sp.]
MSRAKQCAAERLAPAMVALVAGSLIAGCGTPGAPLPPSLNLPDRITDLAALRTGNHVALTWTMPRRNTDKLLLKANIAVHICRAEAPAQCVTATDLSLAPGTAGAYTDNLTGALAAGPPRPLRYFVELRNSRGRSAGPSNAAVVLAGQAPPPVTGIAAEIRKAGIVLRWNPEDSRETIRLQRTLLSPPPAKAHSGPLAPPPEQVQQILLVPSDPGIALDKDIRFGQAYQYRAQRVARMEDQGRTIELASEYSAPVRIDALDVFPPAVPTGLAAVATLATAATPASIDLSWQPVVDPDLAGYFVYRREQETPWQRISGEQPVTAPAFHDPQVVPGHTYIYGVSAVDQRGNESMRSADASETVPNP